MGNALKQDDNIGNVIATELQNLKGVKVLVAGTAPESFLYRIEKLKPEILFVVDAAEFNGSVGDVKLLSLEEISEKTASTHNIPMSFFEEKMPCELKVIGIKVKSTAFGMGLSPELRDLMPAIVQKVRSLVEC